jgi:hypothetical protein
LQALYRAVDVVKNRAQYREITSNPLKVKIEAVEEKI